MEMTEKRHWIRRERGVIDEGSERVNLTEEGSQFRLETTPTSSKKGKSGREPHE